MSKQVPSIPEAPVFVRAKHRPPARPWLPVSLCVAALFTPLFVTPLGSAQRPSGVARPLGKAPQGPAVAAKSARNAAVAAATDEVLKETSEIRQLSILRPVQSGTLSRAEIERSIIKNLDQDMTPEAMHASEVTLKKLGLAPSDLQYRSLMIKVLTEQVAGYYDPKSQEFYLADWIDLDGQKPIMAHELTHALQDQHFNLRRFEHWPKGDSDAELAAHALIEGDAMLVMGLYVASDLTRALAFRKSLTTTGMASDELGKAPRAVRESLLFPYQEGSDWTRSLYKEGGWDRVSKAFAELPQSTEQIMHPEKYFAHEAPVKVTLPDISSVLNGSRSGTGVSPVSSSVIGSGTGVPPVSSNAGARFAFTSYSQNAQIWSAATRRRFGVQTNHAQAARASWRRIDTDVEGEWGLYLLLDQFLKSPADSHRAAAGWGGDRYEVYEGPNGQACFVSLSVWDTENDAREFFDAYVKRTALRYPNCQRMDAPTAEEQTRNSKVESRNPEAIRFRTSEGVVTIERRDARVLVLEGTPDGIDSNALLKSLRQ